MSKERKEIKTLKLPFGEHMPEGLTEKEREEFLKEKLGIKPKKEETKEKKDN